MTFIESLQPESLDALSEAEWKDLADADLRKGAHHVGPVPAPVAAAIRTPEYIDRWYAALLAIQSSLDGQLEMRRSDHDADKAAMTRDILDLEMQLEAARDARDRNLVNRLGQKIGRLRIESEDLTARYLRKRTGMIRFKSGLDEALVECTSLRTQLVRQAQAEIDRLRSAIERHRATIYAEDIQPSDIDEELWKALTS